MSDSQPPEPDGSMWHSLLSTPEQVVRYLQREPLLLAGVGAAVLVSIVALFAPVGAAPYAWLIAGVVFAACLLWFIASVLRDRRRGRPSGNVLRTGRGSRTADLNMVALGQTQQKVTTGTRAELSRASLYAAASPPAPPGPPEIPKPSDPAPEDDGLTMGSPTSQKSPRLFVGRRAELDEIVALLAGTRDGVVVDLVGVSGVGKSSLLEQLAAEVRTVPGAVLRHSDRALRPDGHRADRGAAASPAVLRHTFAEAVQLMRTLAGESHRDFSSAWEVVDESHTWNRPVEVHQHNVLQVGRKASATGVTIQSQVSMAGSEDDLRTRILAAQERLDDAFVQVWRGYTSSRPVLLTVDSFERCLDDEFGSWLLRFALRLPRTVVVVARIPGDDPMPVRSSRIHERWLPNFTVAEVAGYLDRRLVGEPVAADVVQLIHEFTEGLPGGVLLLGELLNERRPGTVSVAELRRVLARLPDDINDRWAKVVDEILTTLPERSAVRAAAVVSSFDEPLLAELLGTGRAGLARDVTTSAAAAAIKALRRRRLLGPVTTPSGLRSNRYRVHEFIRQSVARELRGEEATWWQALHGRAAAHYFGLLQKEWEGEEGGYTGWYRYENENWQWYKREWLRHESHLTDQRPVTRTRFARVFLDAFWWWGCYHPFPFNRDLLDDWDRAAATWQPLAAGPLSGDRERERDEQFGDALRFLLTHYPVGYRKTGAPWAETGDQLLLLRSLCELDGGQRRLSEDDADNARGTGALIDLFLAHSVRFADPADDWADEYYRRAQRGFAGIGDGWTVAWLDMEQADLALERGRYAEVEPLLAEAAAAAAGIGSGGDGWDHELLANLHRIHADLAWQRGELAEAGARYGRAVADAYWFQGIPHPADLYTQSFYAEMVQRTGARLAELTGRVDEAFTFVEGLVRTLPRPVPGGADALRDLLSDPAELADRLLPAGPLASAAQSASDSSPFMVRWRRDQRRQPEPVRSLTPLLAGTDPGISPPAG